MKYLLVTFLAAVFTVGGCKNIEQTDPDPPSIDTFVYTTMVNGVLETYITTVHIDTIVNYFLQDASPTRIQLMIQKSRIQGNVGLGADTRGTYIYDLDTLDSK